MLKRIVFAAISLAAISALAAGGFFLQRAWFRGDPRPKIEDFAAEDSSGPAQNPPTQHIAAQAATVAAEKDMRPGPDQWPGFRGPLGTGVAATAQFPEKWSSSSNLAWKTDLPGPGSSSPIVWGDSVFVTCYSGYGEGSSGRLDDLVRHLVRADKSTGKIVWTKTVPSAAPEDAYRGYLTEHGYASQTPVTDGQTVFAFFGKSGVVAFDFAGNQLWQTSVGTSSSNRRWGSAASLVLYKGLVIVNASEESRSLKALDKKTGSIVWEAKGASLELCYGTPVLMEPVAATSDAATTKTELVLALPGEVWGINPDTGKLLWFAHSPLTGNISPSVAVANDTVIAFGGYPNTGSFALKAGGRGDVTQTHALWKGSKSSYVPSPVIKDKHLYWLNDRGQACCAEIETGNLVYQQRLPIGGGDGASRPVYASVILAGDNIVGVTRQSGTVIFKASPQFSLVGINKIDLDDSDFNSSPAISGDRLFLRSNRALYCIQRQTGN